MGSANGMARRLIYVLGALGALGAALSCASGHKTGRPAEAPALQRQTAAPARAPASKKARKAEAAPKKAPEAKAEAPRAVKTSPLREQFQNARATATYTGKATYYGDSLAGHRTANGETYEPKAFTAAHKKLPFGTIVRVTRLDSGEETYVRITDRGPFGPKDRIIDLSRAAAEELNMIRAGVVRIRAEIVGKIP